MCKDFLKPTKAKAILFLVLFAALPGIGVIEAKSVVDEAGQVMVWESFELGATNFLGWTLIGTVIDSVFSIGLYGAFGPPLVLAGLAILQIAISYLLACMILFAFEKIKAKK